ncbi:MAG TPA: GNAT family N-acetyltransferase [Caldilineaceae bacterium]|nr:GNAT family N-acetyltransferase [Caldilineaceae bacterium]
MITYLTSTETITVDQLQGFFVGWPNPPTPATHLRLLRQSDLVVLALDKEAQRVVGFITALTDGVLSAYIPLLEVLPSYQGRGIGRALVEQILDRLRTCYAIDLLCDVDVQPFYARLGFRPFTGMLIRNYEQIDVINSDKNRIH